MPNLDQPVSGLIRRAIASLADDSRVVASALTASRRQHGLNDAALARWLGLEPSGLDRLALCWRPQPDAADFDAQVIRTAAYVGCLPDRLALLLRGS